jgi:ubiquinone biosynthesis protein
VFALVRTRMRGPIGGAEHGRLLRRLAESLGCTAVKFGQLLGMRRDVFPGEFCREMSKVQDRALGFPGDIAVRILREDLGPAFAEAFTEFDPTPLAAASIGQVHLARLRSTGRRVAIKVRRPFVVEQMALDLRWLGRLFRLLTWLRVKPSFAWDDLFWELRTALREETDYRLEAAYLARMRDSLDAHQIHVPEVFSQYASERVLVMEYIEGVSMADLIAVEQDDPDRVARWLDENGISREVVGRKLNHSMNRQIFEDNFFHSDLHPGNILLLRDNEVALIDLGAAGSLEAEFLQKYVMYYQAIVARQFDRAVDLLLLLAPQSVANARTDEFRRRYLAVMKSFETRSATGTLSYHERSIVSVFGEIMKELAALEIPLDWAFMRADRAQLTLDASLMYLLPRVDYLQLVGDYWRDAKARIALGSARSILAPRGLGRIAGTLQGVLENVEEAQRLGAGALRAHSTSMRPVLGPLVLTCAAVLQLASDALAVLVAAGAITYLNAGAADVAGRLHMSGPVTAWRGLPPAAVSLALLLLVSLFWKTLRLKAKLLGPRPR